jgi:hypothetical protein
MPARLNTTNQQVQWRIMPGKRNLEDRLTALDKLREAAPELRIESQPRLARFFAEHRASSCRSLADR